MYYGNMRGKKRSTKKKRGRPATGQDPVTAIRLPPKMLEVLDLWRPIYPDARSRSEFIRRMLVDGLNANIRKQQRYAESHAAETHARLMAGGATFTPEREREVTTAIKGRMLYEGACDLPWADYFDFREKNKCASLTSSDQRYAGQYSTCKVPT
jgi:hypothetical protein